MGTTAIAYLRVSTPGQVDGDGFDRQRQAVQDRAQSLGLTLVGEYRDEGVSGTLGLAQRPGLGAALERIRSNGVRVVLVEKMDRLSRDLVEGELILREFRKLGVRVVEAEGGHDLTEGDSNPTATLIRQVLGAVAQFEKATLVAKMQAGRRRTGRLGGQPGYGDDVLAAVRRLRRKNPKTGRRRSAQQIADELTKLGLPTRGGEPWSRHTVRDLLARI
jgi:DNA invertase Pin-like site-specific DNA recombinase